MQNSRGLLNRLRETTSIPDCLGRTPWALETLISFSQRFKWSTLGSSCYYSLLFEHFYSPDRVGNKL
jgi:hypothetical protein